MKRITVQAAPGRRVPKEGAARRFITTPETVPDTPYYRRRITDGDLELAPEQRETPEITAKKGGKTNVQP